MEIVHLISSISNILSWLIVGVGLAYVFGGYKKPSAKFLIQMMLWSFVGGMLGSLQYGLPDFGLSLIDCSCACLLSFFSYAISSSGKIALVLKEIQKQWMVLVTTVKGVSSYGHIH